MHPLTPPDCDLRGFEFMPIDIMRLFRSRFHATATDAEWRAGVTLWLKSFHEIPAGSLPDNEVELCRLAELGRDLRTWRRVAPVALHGWLECDDGRLYHPVVCEKVLDAWARRVSRRERGAKGNAVRWHRDRSSDPSAIAGSSQQTGTVRVTEKIQPGEGSKVEVNGNPPREGKAR